MEKLFTNFCHMLPNRTADRYGTGFVAQIVQEISGGRFKFSDILWFHIRAPVSEARRRWQPRGVRGLTPVSLSPTDIVVMHIVVILNP